MAIFNVRKNGSGTHTTIQSAFIQAVSGDTIDVGPGVFEENVDFYKSGITLQGAGKDLTEIRGVLETNSSKTCTFSSGSTTLNVPGGTSGWLVGRFLSGVGLPTNARIVSVSSTSVVISSATTSARTNQTVVMPAVPSAVVVRGANHKVKGLKITAPQALESRCLADNAAIFFRTSGNGEVPASAYILEDCIIEARGESAIMTDAAAGVGNGIIRNNVIQGQTFVGSSAAQVPAFGTMTKTGRVLSNRTIEFSDLSGITAPHAGNSQGSEITPGLRVASISGNVVTVTANIPDAVGTTRSFSFANVQFNFPNVARQLVVLQGANTASQFLNNLVKGKTGSGISYNTAVTVDMANAVITGNTMNGEFKFGYALRARGAGATVSNNVNYSLPGKENAGYLIGPTGSQSFGATVGTNTSILKDLIGSSQVAGVSSVTFEMNKQLVKQNSKVSSHPIFSQESNWKLVNYVFKHDSSSRRLVSSFRSSFDSSKKTKLKANMKIGDRFELQKIIISKANRTHLVLKRSEISEASNFDFSLLSDGPEASNGGGSGGGGGVIVDPPVDPPVLPAVAMGSFFDGRLPLNSGTWSKNSDTTFFAAANRFVTVGDYYHSQGGNVSFGGLSLKNAIIDTTTNDLNKASSKLLQDKRIRSVHYKSDLSKAWVIGQFGTEYEGTQLPALPAYNGTTFQSSNCFRILEINLSSGAIVHKLDIQTSYDAVGFGGQHSQMLDMKIDETSGDVFLLNGSYVAKYNFTTGAVWGKSIANGYSSNQKYSFKLTLTSDSIFINVRNYDGVELTGYSWNNGGYIKISKLDGSRDTSFVIPNENNNYYPEVVRAISSDGSKIVYAIYDTSVNSLVAHTYSNGSWTKHSNIRMTNGGLFGLIAENDHFYILSTSSSFPYAKYIQKVDYSGNSRSIANLDINSNDYYQSPLAHTFYKRGEKIYYVNTSAQLKKHDIATGVTETLDIPLAFTGNDQLILSFNGNKAIVGVENYDFQMFTFKDASYLEIPATQNTVAVGVYNASTGELVKATAYAATDYFEQKSTRILKSSSISGKCWFVTAYGKVHEIDLATGNVSLVSNLSFGSGSDYDPVKTFTDGNFLYAIGRNNQFSVIDSTGTYTKNYMARINLSTKLLDQSFSISDPSWEQTGYRNVDVTDNFIYVTSGQYTKSMVRFRKSNFTKQTIDYTTTFPASSIQYRQEVVGIGKLDSTKIIVYGKNKQFGQTSGWAKPYLIFDEESMTPVASQPSFTGEADASTYFPEFGKLVAVASAANYWEKEVAVFDVVTGTKSVYISASQYAPSGQSPMFNGGYPNNIIFHDNHIFIEMGYTSNFYKNKHFTGIIKVNSSGEVVE